ncbi:MAG: hypothetical protein KGQ70_08620 [Alphaproteobacteria bacterium]|nr:hypothetical protein [Alphaproteobacteria bacterium]
MCAFTTLLLFSVTARAASPHAVAGCDPTVWTAMTAKAAAQVVYDAAVTDELINKPDSVLTLTCFSDAAGVSAKNGGAIFSGDFTTQLQTIMPVTGGGSYNCTAIGTLEDEILNHGVDTGAPFATFNDLMSGKAPSGGGSDFTAGWKAASTASINGTQGVFQNLNTAVNALPKPTTFDFSQDKSSCDVLKTAGIVQSCP